MPFRKIIHLDMDAFYASVEQRDDPSLRGKPVVVGGTPDGRGVVAAASYEARKYGVYSAMPARKAIELCPNAVFIKPRIHIYRRISRMIMGILREYTELVEPLAFDEAFLDVTVNKRSLPYATAVAKNIRERIFQLTDLQASAGVAPNKFLAKIASKRAKPNGMKVIVPEEIDAFIPTLSVREVPGIGPKMEERLYDMGIESLAHLQEFNEVQLIELLGSKGSWFYSIARGVDNRAVIPERERKSVGVERTYSEDITSRHEAIEKLEHLSQELAKRLRRNNVAGKTLTLKVTYSDFQKSTRSITKDTPIYLQESLNEEILELIPQTGIGERPVRLLGLSVSHLIDISKAQAENDGTQLSLI